MTLTKVLIDTNICLDALLHRKPFYIHALQLMERSQMGAFDGVVAAHSFDTIFYLINKNNRIEKTYKGINIIRKAYDVAPVTTQIIDDALAAEWNDFEDAIHYYLARDSGCTAIITRNEADFTQADLPVFSPQEFLDQLNNDEQ